VLQVREFEKSDLNSFISLLLTQTAEKPDRHDKNGLRLGLQQRLQNLLKIKETHHRPVILVAVTSEKLIVGYLIIQWLYELWADSPEALISSLYVSKEWRNYGVGTRLLQGATTAARELSCARIWLENNRSNSIYLKQFYTKRGWKERKDLAVFEFELKSNKKG
jgi:GNAT superfamily N-acetyltransferase